MLAIKWNQLKVTGEKIAEALGNFLADAVPVSSVTILGPAPCVLEKLHGRFRQHLIIKNQAGKQGHELVTSFLKTKLLAKTCR